MSVNLPTFPYTPPNGPDTFDILQGTANVINAIIAPIPFNGLPILKTVQVGGIKEYPSVIPVCAVTFKNGPSTRKDFGGVVENEVHALISFFADYTQAFQAEKWITRVYDLITSYFGENTTLVDGIPVGETLDTSVYPFGVHDVRLVPNSPTGGFITQNVPIPLRALQAEVVACQRFVSPYGVKRYPR